MLTIYIYHRCCKTQPIMGMNAVDSCMPAVACTLHAKTSWACGLLDMHCKELEKAGTSGTVNF